MIEQISGLLYCLIQYLIIACQNKSCSPIPQNIAKASVREMSAWSKWAPLTWGQKIGFSHIQLDFQGFKGFSGINISQVSQFFFITWFWSIQGFTGFISFTGCKAKIYMFHMRPCQVDMTATTLKKKNQLQTRCRCECSTNNFVIHLLIHSLLIHPFPQNLQNRITLSNDIQKLNILNKKRAVHTFFQHINCLHSLVLSMELL